MLEEPTTWHPLPQPQDHPPTDLVKPGPWKVGEEHHTASLESWTIPALLFDLKQDAQPLRPQPRTVLSTTGDTKPEDAAPDHEAEQEL